MSGEEIILAAINKLGERIGKIEEGQIAMKKDIDTMKGDINMMKDDINMLKNNMSIMKKDIDMMKGDINMMKDDINMLKGNMSIMQKDIDMMKVDIKDLKIEKTGTISEFSNLVRMIAKFHSDTNERLEVLERKTNVV